MKINENTYLLFFHSSRDPPETGDVLKTYYMGALTFSSKPPFSIMSITTVPITHDIMYKGSWSDLPLSYYSIDYIVFPMGYILINKQSSSSSSSSIIYLFYGRQDKQGWVARIDLANLLSSMKPLKSSSLSISS